MSYTSVNVVAFEEAVYNHRSEEDTCSCAAVFFHTGDNGDEKNAALDYSTFNTAFSSQRTTIDMYLGLKMVSHSFFYGPSQSGQSVSANTTGYSGLDYINEQGVNDAPNWQATDYASPSASSWVSMTRRHESVVCDINGADYAPTSIYIAYSRTPARW